MSTHGTDARGAGRFRVPPLLVVLVIASLLLIWVVFFFRTHYFASVRIRDEPLFSRMARRGRDLAAHRKIVFCALVRDVAPRIPGLVADVERLGAVFADYRLLIVENDSRDGTREALLWWRERNPRVTVLGCGRNTPHCCLRLPATHHHRSNSMRIDKMTYLRNEYMKELDRTAYDDCSYCAVWDLDIDGTLFLDGVFNTLAYLENRRIDSMAANAFNAALVPSMADPFAHVGVGKSYVFPFHPMHSIANGVLFLPQVGAAPFRVWSAFGGFAVYKMRAIRGSRYRRFPAEQESADGQPPIVCEHVAFHAQLRHYLNPSMLFFQHAND